MYYNVKKLTVVSNKIQEYIDIENTKEKTSWSDSGLKTEDIRKIFESQNIDALPSIKELNKYSWSSWNLDDLKKFQKDLKKELTKQINIEDQQPIPDSVIDTFIEDSRDVEIGSMKFMFGELSQKDQNIMRDVARKVYEYTKSRNYE